MGPACQRAKKNKTIARCAVSAGDRTRDRGGVRLVRCSNQLAKLVLVLDNRRGKNKKSKRAHWFRRKTRTRRRCCLGLDVDGAPVVVRPWENDEGEQRVLVKKTVALVSSGVGRCSGVLRLLRRAPVSFIGHLPRCLKRRKKGSRRCACTRR